MERLFFFALAISFLAVSCTGQPSATDADVLPPTDYAKKMAELGEVQLIDVRTPGEYEAGHLDGAILIDFTKADFMERIEAQCDKRKPVMLYCQVGGRSGKALARLKAAGFEAVYDLQGGYAAWARR